MTTLSPSILRECPNCGQELTPGVLACPECHALVHGAELGALVREAGELEKKGELAQARELWSRMRNLLPADCKQAGWVEDHLRALETRQAALPEAGTGPERPWMRRLGPLAPIALLLVKSKGLLLAIFKLKFLLSFFTYAALYAAIFGWRFGVGFAVSILIHELGHFVDIKRRGLPAEMPVFLPGLGAYVRWCGLGVTRRQIAEISLAGPLAGWIAAAVCLLLYTRTANPLWAALAHAGAVINVINLIPVWMLDGGKAADSLGHVQRAGLLAATLGIGLFTWQPIFFLVSAGAAFRLFTKDQPKRDDWRSLLYYVAVLAALGCLLHSIPLIPAATAGR